MTAFAAPQELHDLAFRYALAVDTRDPAMLVSIFTHDGVVRGYGENPIEFAGAEGLTRMIAQVDASFDQTMHNVFNQTFERADDGTVSGLTTCIASHMLKGEGCNLLDFAMRYHNRYAQEEGRWKFAERRLEVVWVETRPVQKFTAAMMASDLREFR
ncbi:nuclear transport factor 2 family protein [Sphingorhabdus contaminans]|uniref:nuclear transport factor 2 family protein n=1 Tax=Sphingorhabdus contaminans TaxID=1343899 RepID=UPI00147758FA|nr:nuclear transport factor 2 family protein [Sphingorhabdus contaminans]